MISKDNSTDRESGEQVVRLLDGLLVVFFPHGIFTAVNRRLPAGTVFGAAFIATGFLVAGAGYYVRQLLQGLGPLTALTIGIALCSVFFVLILLTGAASWLLDVGYCRWLFFLKKAQPPSQFVGNFLCRLLGMPWWLLAALLCARAANADPAGIWYIAAIVLLIRLTVLEACLLQVVYAVSTLQSYLAVLTQSVLIGCGMGAGAVVLSLAALFGS